MDQASKEARAFDCLAKLLTAAQECRVLFDEAGVDYPVALRRVLGELDGVASNGANRPRHIRITPPPVARPAGVPDASIYIPIAALTPQTVAVGVLRGAQGPMSVRQIVAEMKHRGTEVNPGSVANMGPRLEDRGVITRQKDGWVLADPSKAAVLNGQYGWGHPDIFTVHELAARRREALLHVLEHFRDGLQQTQILTQLEDCAWLRTPLNKDLLKLDIEELQKDGKIRRVGGSKKWMLNRANP